MRRKAVFFDRDNTLIISDGYLGDPERVALVPGAAEAVARVRAMGFAAVVISNQSGVARGMFDEAAVRAVNARMEELLRAENPGAVIDHHEYCPFHPEGVVEIYRQDSDLRKPKAGMIYKAREALALDLQGSWVIGDAPRDVEAGRSAGCKTILFSDPGLPQSPAAAEARSGVRPDYTCATLKDAVDFVQRSVSPATSARPALDVPKASYETALKAHVVPERTEGGPVERSERAAVAPPPQVSAQPAAPAPSNERVEQLLGQILSELKRRQEREHTEFSVPRLLAGIVQIIALAVLIIAYLYTGNTAQNWYTLQSLLLLAVVLQTMVVALVLMGRR
jgi:D-glycero-D-manno-heptose 1,7-bisphosphate phosphatase